MYRQLLAAPESKLLTSPGIGTQEASLAGMVLASFLDLPLWLYSTLTFYYGIGWELFISVAYLRPSTYMSSTH